MRVAPLLLVLLLLGAGCADAPQRDDPSAKPLGKRGVVAGPVQTGTPPTGCDAARKATVHGADGQLVAVDMPVGVGCFVTTPWGGYEPSIGLTSDGTLFLYPTWLQANLGASVADRFTGMGIARTRDHGATWTRHQSNIGPINWHFFTADPFMYVDPYTNRIFMEDLIIPPFNCSSLSYSDDGGQTWAQTLGGCAIWDHVSFGSGKPVTSTPTGYATIVYRCGIGYGATTLASFGTACQKSLDGGRFWQPPGEPAFLMGPNGPYGPSQCHGAAHHVFVDHRGWVWLPRGWCGIPYVAVSKDEGATWQRYRVHPEPMPGGTVAHDAGVGVDANGTAYYFWMKQDMKPYLSISRDDGKTWSAPINVGPPGVLRAGNPSLTAGAAGRIGLTYAANLEAAPGVHAVVSVGYFADTGAPVFQTVFANNATEPLSPGNCNGYTCAGQQDFITITMGPEGAPWSSYMNRGRVAAGTLWGAPSLWDESDPNGRYK